MRTGKTVNERWRFFNNSDGADFKLLRAVVESIETITSFVNCKYINKNRT